MALEEREQHVEPVRGRSGGGERGELRRHLDRPGGGGAGGGGTSAGARRGVGPLAIERAQVVGAAGEAPPDELAVEGLHRRPARPAGPARLGGLRPPGGIPRDSDLVRLAGIPRASNLARLAGIRRTSDLERPADLPEGELRRAEQGDQRLPREVLPDAGEDEVDGGRVRLGRQGQPVVDGEREPVLRRDRRRQVEIRQRALHDERRPLGRRALRGRPARDPPQLLLPVAPDEVTALAGRAAPVRPRRDRAATVRAAPVRPRRDRGRDRPEPPPSDPDATAPRPSAPDATAETSDRSPSGPDAAVAGAGAARGTTSAGGCRAGDAARSSSSPGRRSSRRSRNPASRTASVAIRVTRARRGRRASRSKSAG